MNLTFSSFAVRSAVPSSGRGSPLAGERLSVSTAFFYILVFLSGEISSFVVLHELMAHPKQVALLLYVLSVLDFPVLQQPSFR